MLEIFDYELLRIIWWILLGVLLIGFAIMDGFDLGVGILLPFVAKNDSEKRIVINSVGPVWDGNQVWFILGGGAIFAAWPHIYAVSFSGFYFAMLLVLLALILRPVGFDFRSKIDNPIWRNFWDICLFIAGLVPSLVFGVAIGNVLMGVDFSFNEFMVIDNQIKFFSLFTPFSLLCGILSVVILTTQGACYLAIKTENEIQMRVIKLLKILPIIAIILYAIGGYFISTMDGYQLLSPAKSLGDSNPLNKQVTRIIGGWLNNYNQHPYFIIAPLLGFLGAIFVVVFAILKQYGKAFISSSLSILGIIASVGLSMFPFILPSSLNPNASLLVWDASSSYHTLVVMLIAVIIFMPLILLYTSWVFHVLRGKVTKEDVKKNSNFLY
jgi:cytochrome d ubiquinol oxidase subunit II